MILCGIHQLRALVLVVAAVTTMTETVLADDPNVATRTFAEVTAKNGAGIDWESKSSRRIVAHRAGSDADVIEFGTPGNGWYPSDFAVLDDDGALLVDLRNTMWVQVPVVHITDTGADHIRYVYWLVDTDMAPQTGITAKTGPNGAVATFVSFGISQIPVEEGFNGGKYRVLPGGNTQFRVSIGDFNK